jgi:hypothetical protein
MIYINWVLSNILTDTLVSTAKDLLEEYKASERAGMEEDDVLIKNKLSEYVGSDSEGDCEGDSEGNSPFCYISI